MLIKRHCVICDKVFILEKKIRNKTCSYMCAKISRKKTQEVNNVDPKKGFFINKDEKKLRVNFFNLKIDYINGTFNGVQQ